MYTPRQPFINPSLIGPGYLDEDISDADIVLGEVEMSRCVDEETGVENGKQDDEGDVCLETADEDDKDGETPSKEPNCVIRVEALARKALGDISRRGIRCSDPGRDVIDRGDGKPKDTHDATVQG
jgi:hypothetical protein